MHQVKATLNLGIGALLEVIAGTALAIGLAVILVNHPPSADAEQPQFSFAFYGVLVTFTWMSGISGAVAGLIAATIHKFRPAFLRTILVFLGVYLTLLTLWLYLTGFFAASE